MKIKETFDVTPDTSVMIILGSSGYSLAKVINLIKEMINDLKLKTNLKIRNKNV